MAKIYHVKTQEDYDALMVELEGKGYKWSFGSNPTAHNNWEKFAEKTCVRFEEGGHIEYDENDYYIQEGHEITEYTATNNVNSLTAHEIITAGLFDTYKRKNHDYGDSFTESLNEFGLVAGLVRVGDKVNRLKSLTKNEQQVSDESLRDTILDASNYLIMMAMWMDSEAND